MTVAIFAGTWTDGSGGPWDESAAVVQTYAGGGVVRGRRHGLTRTRAMDRFVTMMRSTGAQWLQELSSSQRGTWQDQAEIGTTRRGSPSQTPGLSFRQFVTFAGVGHYYDSGLNILPAGTGDVGLASASIDAIDVGAQTVTVSTIGQAGFGDFPNSAVVVYQISPRATLWANPWRLTRSLAMARVDDFTGDDWTGTLPLAWPVASGELLRLFLRARFSYYWTAELDLTDTAP